MSFSNKATLPPSLPPRPSPPLNPGQRSSFSCSLTRFRTSARLKAAPSGRTRNAPCAAVHRVGTGFLMFSICADAVASRLSSGSIWWAADGDLTLTFSFVHGWPSFQLHNEWGQGAARCFFPSTLLGQDSARTWVHLCTPKFTPRVAL